MTGKTSGEQARGAEQRLREVGEKDERDILQSEKEKRASE